MARRCYLIDVDGLKVRAVFDGVPTDEDVEAFRELIRSLPELTQLLSELEPGPDLALDRGKRIRPVRTVPDKTGRFS